MSIRVKKILKIISLSFINCFLVLTFYGLGVVLGSIIVKNL